MLLIYNLDIYLKGQKRMSRIKAWKQLNHVKNEQFKDNQSVASLPRSSSSYQYNKIRFSKSKIEYDQGSTRNLGLASVIKAKQRSRQHSILNLNDSKRRSMQNSLPQMSDKQPIRINLKTPQNKKFEMKVKGFMLSIQKIHDDLRQVAENMLRNFQQVKQQMQINLLKVTNQLLKMSKDAEQISKINQIIQNGFLNVRRNIIVLPSSLTQLNNGSQSQIIRKKAILAPQPLSPTLNPNQRQFLYKPKITSIFSPKQRLPGTTRHFQRLQFNQLGSVEKVRPQTQRKRISVASPFDKLDKSPEPRPKTKQNYATYHPQDQSTIQIEQIIRQMREILNQ